MSAPPPDNQKDLELLKTDLPALLLRHQQTVQIIVRRYVSSGMFKWEDFEDTVQSVNEQLIVRMPSIQSGFNGTTLFRTYFSAIVRNICLSLYKGSQRQPKMFRINESIQAAQDETSDHHHIEHARQLFKVVMKQFDYKSDLPRLLFLLKLRYKIPIQKGDVLGWYPRCPREDFATLLTAFGKDYQNWMEKEIYAFIAPIMNRALKKENSPDSLRKWTLGKIAQIIELLNGNPPRAAFNEETLKILVEDFFSPFLLNQE
jgi:RNA polymerase sigma factor (sigma-70 family)